MAVPSPHGIVQRPSKMLRGAGLAVLATIGAGCAADRVETPRTGHVPVIADYAAPADTAYDPWAPYIAEAALRFDVPEAWIREVMQRESSGRHRVVSRSGAMGLMQVMPGTWQGLRARYRLGRDPFHPRDNILAGTAYIREMYDRFGAPGFLAAYNAGPGAFARSLAGRRVLPRETRRFVAAIAPRIEGIVPDKRTAPAAYAAVPAEIAGSRQRAGRGTSADPARPPRPTPPARLSPPVALAARPEAPAPLRIVTPALAPVRDAGRVQAAAPPPATVEPRPGGFQLISAARAATLPVATAAEPPVPAQDPAPPAAVLGAWAIQVGAFRTVEPARSAIEQARAAAPELLAFAQPATPNVDTANGRFVRARLIGLSPEAAAAACRLVTQRGQGCFAVAPAARG